MGEHIENDRAIDTWYKLVHMSNCALRASEYTANMYNTINNLRYEWEGKAYDNAIDVPNGFVDDLNRMFKECVEWVPTKLAWNLFAFSDITVEGFGGLNRDTTARIDRIEKTNKGSKVTFSQEHVYSRLDSIDSLCHWINVECDNIISEIYSVYWWWMLEGQSDIDRLEAYANEIKSFVNQSKDHIKRCVWNFAEGFNNMHREVLNESIQFEQNAKRISQQIQEDAEDGFEKIEKNIKLDNNF